MNGGDSGGGSDTRKLPGRQPKYRKDRDEDLLLFREMHKQEGVVSLLQPDSVEFEANGNYPLYRVPSAKKGYEFLGEGGKNDYDWLKTPPATPLFPSLEMEAGNAPELLLQREIPILHPLTRFSGNPKPKPITEKSLVTPNGLRPIRTSVSAPETKPSGTKSQQATTPNLQKPNPPRSTSSKRATKASTITKVSAKVTNQQQQQQQAKKFASPQQNFLASNLSKSLQQGPSEPKTKPRSRGVSPSMRPMINPATFSDETPTNLKTDRSLSATRGRDINGNHRANTTPLKRETNNVKSISNTTPLKRETDNTKPIRRQSCSPSVTRGRKIEPKQESNKMLVGEGNTGTQILGSRMVDRFMNARKLSTTAAAAAATTASRVEERELRAKPINMRASLNESPGFGMKTSKNSLNMGLKHMELK